MKFILRTFLSGFWPLFPLPLPEPRGALDLPDLTGTIEPLDLETFLVGGFDSDLVAKGFITLGRY